MGVYVFRLSLECPKLSLAEVEGILAGERVGHRVKARIGEFLLLDVDDEYANLIGMRAALVREFGALKELIALPRDEHQAAKFIRDSIECVREVESVRSLHKDLARKLFEEFRRSKALSKSCRLKIALVDGYAVVYEVTKPGRVARFGDREPHKRPAYLPGTMKPWLARVFVNLAAVSALRHEVLLDPFCGVGGFALEGGVQGLRIVCGDIDLRMVRASVQNISGYKLEGLCDVVQLDASAIPLRRSSVDGIATDPPYGRMSFPQRYSLPQLLTKFIEEAIEILRCGRRAVFAVPHSVDDIIKEVLKNYVRSGKCQVVHRILQYVHSSLTRVIYVVRKL